MNSIVGKLLGYMCEDGLGGDIGISLQVRVMKVGTVEEKRPVWKVRGRELIRMGGVRRADSETYKSEDSVCASFLVLHIFFVFKLLYTCDIHGEDSSRRVAVGTFLQSGAIMAGVL